MQLNRENLLSSLTSFKRSQMASGISSLVDYSCLLFLTEFCHVWYILSAAIGGFLGGSINFYLNRRWSFHASSDAWHRQAFRYFIVSVTSLIINLTGTYFLKEFLKVHYFIASMILSFFVGLVFNFPMQKFYIYRIPSQPKHQAQPQSNPPCKSSLSYDLGGDSNPPSFP